MLFIYLLEENPVYVPRVIRHLDQALRRGDVLVTSCLGIGEELEGGRDFVESKSIQQAEACLSSLFFDLLRFDAACIPIFSRLRSDFRSARRTPFTWLAPLSRVDMFLTADEALLKLSVPGVRRVE